MSNSPLALIGYRGTGKTTVAQQIALRIGYDWVDADVEVELALGKSIAEIFAELGEAEFRVAESRVLQELCSRERTVLALGGGAVLAPANRELLKNCQAVVWLTASPATIEQRMGGDPTTAERRPNLTNHGGRTEIEALLAQREPIYRACATLEVDTEDRTPAEIAEQIVLQLRLN